MYGGIGVCDPARQLGQLAVDPHVGKLVEVALARLLLHLVEVDRASVDAHRGACLHSTCRDAVTCDALGEAEAGRFGTASPRQLGAPDVHQSVEEGACREYHATGAQDDIKVCDYARDTSVFHQQLFHLILPEAQAGCVLEHLAPRPDELSAVALGTRTPHGGPFRAVQHAKLDGGTVRDESHLPSKCVYLPDYLPLGNASDGWIA